MSPTCSSPEQRRRTCKTSYIWRYYLRFQHFENILLSDEDIESGMPPGANCCPTVQGHTAGVASAVFSPDSASSPQVRSKTARVFRVVTLSEIADLLANWFGYENT